MVQDMAEHAMTVATKEVTGGEVKIFYFSIHMVDGVLFLGGSSLIPTMTQQQMIFTLLCHACLGSLVMHVNEHLWYVARLFKQNCK